MRRTLVGFCALLMLPFALTQAEDKAVIEVPLYRGTVVVDQAATNNTEWYLPLAKYQKINGLWRFSNALDLRGNVKKSTYLIQSHDLYNNIADFYQAWTGLSEISVLFSCKNRSCGSSNEWANGHFHVRNLYGLEGKQRYWALQTASGYIAMYLIERGNGKIYLQVEELTSI